jgi:Ca2+-binding EF-hand superfamily protein
MAEEALSPAEMSLVNQIRQEFGRVDRNKDGLLSKEELLDFLERWKVDEEHRSQIV